VEGLDDRVRGGDIFFEGKKIGAHHGYPFYTIGQRHGLNIALGEPMFVTHIDAASNTVTVGRNDDLLHRECLVHSVTMQKIGAMRAPLQVLAKIRYKDEGAPALLLPQSDGGIRLRFDEARRAITPGQSTVWYDGDDVIGGGIIGKVIE
jgi:tRNA-specific 2-thiouridylase